MNKRTVIIIPARLGSTRLPGKVLLDICGKPMIERVYDKAKEVNNIDSVYIATDSEEVLSICKGFTDNVILTKEHNSGTDRLAEAVQNIDCDNVINIQGDEPLIDIDLIEKLNNLLIEGNNDMVTVYHRIKTLKELKTKNTVKVVVGSNNNALYFSRSIIPYDRDDMEDILKEEEIDKKYDFKKHIGVYGYSKDFLIKYSKLEQTALEKRESLEQLRILEKGFSIGVLETKTESKGVDTIEDLIEVRKIIESRNEHL